MKTTSAALLLCALFATGAAFAATPPGHPAPQAGNAAADLPHKGKVVSAIDTGQYTYIEVTSDKATVWLAAPAIALKKGNTIRYEDGAEMSNFYSKTLNRTFPSIQFIGRVVLVADAK